MPEITINVKCSNDQKYSVTIDTSKTVLEFKQAIAEKCDTTADRQRLIYSGRVLKDNDTLDTYKIAEGHTVHMVKGSAPSGSSPTQPSQQSQPTTAGNTQAPQQPTGYSPNPFMMGGFNQGANPYGAPFGTTGGLQGVNPLDFLQNPAIMQYMQQMLQDPQFVESMIHMNPQFASMAPQIRQMMQDPEFQAMMSNPETLRSLAALQPLMGNLGPFTGGAIPGFPGYNMPATTGTNPTNPTTNPTTGNTTGTRNDTTTGSTPTSNTTTPSTTTPSTTTPITPINNPFLPFFNPTAQNAANTGTNPSQPPMMPLFDPSLLWGALGGVPPTTTPTTTTTTPAPTTPQVPPEERFQSQLQQLNDMGFVDAQKNIRALQICQGNVNFAIERLLDPSF